MGEVADAEWDIDLARNSDQVHRVGGVAEGHHDA